MSASCSGSSSATSAVVIARLDGREHRVDGLAGQGVGSGRRRPPRRRRSCSPPNPGRSAPEHSGADCWREACSPSLLAGYPRPADRNLAGPSHRLAVRLDPAAGMRRVAGPPRSLAIARARLTVDLDAIAANWRALDALSGPGSRPPRWSRPTPTGSARRGWRRRWRRRGRAASSWRWPRRARRLRAALGPGPAIYVFAGLMRGRRARSAREHDLIPCLNSAAQAADFAEDSARTGLARCSSTAA